MEFMYFGRVLEASSTEGAECRRKVERGRKVVGAFISLMNGRVLQLQCGRGLHESLLIFILTYGSETMV